MRFHKWLTCVGSLLLILAFLLTNALASEEEKQSDRPMAEPLTSGLLEANSNRQVHPFDTGPVVSQFDTEGFEKIGETDELEIYFNETEASLRILNQNTGYVWGALPIGEAEGLNATWRCYGNGLVSIECFNEKGVESQVSIGKDGTTEYELLENGLLCSVAFKKQGISFQTKVSWEGRKLTMELVDGTLTEGKDGSPYILKSMTFMPYLGSSYSNSIKGYILIPDGSGALIRYRRPANYSSTYAARIYGIDYGIESLSNTTGKVSKPEAQVLMPIYGMVHGAYQNGFFAVVESGAEYATILATPALTNNPYNRAAVRFEYRQKYVKHINRKEGAGATIPQETRNEVKPKISFYFTEGEQANYDGMAVMYRQMLIARGTLSALGLKNAEVPLQVEVLGADKKQGFLWNTTSVFTTAKQAIDIVEELTASGRGRLDLVYRNYTKNNECGKRLLPALGPAADFEQLERTVRACGGTLCYYLDPITANESQINLRMEAANNLSKMEIRLIEPTASDMFPFTYLYRLSEASDRIEKAFNRSYGGEFALAQLSSKLYGDFTTGKEVTRGESLKRVVSMVNAVSKGGKIAMYQPNQYIWQYADKMYDLPVSNSQILYESDCVPFLQIVLSGCVELYGNAINTSSYSTERLLRQIEYGMAPAFTVTGCESNELYNTVQEHYFSTSFDDWRPRIEEAYQIIAGGLNEVWGHGIISHQCLQSGLIRIMYDNGVSIYVNYTDKPLMVRGMVIEPCWFAISKE